MIQLRSIVTHVAAGMMAVDAKRPQAINVRSKQAYQPGLGPHSETITTALVVDEIRGQSEILCAPQIELEVLYPNAPRSKCDLCIGPPQDWEWANEVKMMRLMGHNGKHNDNILMHILSPYPAYRNAVPDCRKILESGFPGRKAIVIFGYDYPDWRQDSAIHAFEVLAKIHLEVSTREESSVGGLVHPVHQQGRVFDWEIRART